MQPKAYSHLNLHFELKSLVESLGLLWLLLCFGFSSGGRLLLLLLALPELGQLLIQFVLLHLCVDLGVATYFRIMLC